MKVILCYKQFRKTLDSIPETIKQLKAEACSSLVSSLGAPIADNEVSLKFLDHDAEMCSIESQEDLD